VSISDAMKAVYMVKAKMRGNKQYKEFLEKTKPVIQAQMGEWVDRLQDKGLMFPLPKATMTMRLYIKDRYRRDTANAQQTIQDLLVDAGVLSDDDDSHLNPYYGASARYYDELIHNIAFISLSFRL
jgi:Holliday junction resolvase RusA-like endonuclease